MWIVTQSEMYNSALIERIEFNGADTTARFFVCRDIERAGRDVYLTRDRNCIPEIFAAIKNNDNYVEVI